MVFLSGNLMQLHSHMLLAQLASNSKKALATDKVGSTSSSGSKLDGVKEQHQVQQRQYSIPHGGMFSLVSCPHYLAEIVIYLGLWVMSGLQMNQALMLAWVVSDPVCCLVFGLIFAWHTLGHTLILLVSYVEQLCEEFSGCMKHFST